MNETPAKVNKNTPKGNSDDLIMLEKGSSEKKDENINFDNLTDLVRGILIYNFFSKFFSRNCKGNGSINEK